MAVINLTGRPIPLMIDNMRVEFPEYRNEAGDIVALQVLTELYDCEEVKFSFRTGDEDEGEVTEATAPILISRSQVAIPTVGEDDIILVNESDLPHCRNMYRVHAPHELSATLDNTGKVICYTRLVSS